MNHMEPAPAGSTTHEFAPHDRGRKELTVEDLLAEAAACTRCPLGETKRSVVFGEGNPRADLMLVGEAPGEKEDESGRPFVGNAGRILNKILDEVGIPREDLYITGVVKCRPPKNRLPNKPELYACVPFLEKRLNSSGPGLSSAWVLWPQRHSLTPKPRLPRSAGSGLNKMAPKLCPPITPPPSFMMKRK